MIYILIIYNTYKDIYVIGHIGNTLVLLYVYYIHVYCIFLIYYIHKYILVLFIYLFTSVLSTFCKCTYFKESLY